MDDVLLLCLFMGEFTELPIFQDAWPCMVRSGLGMAFLDKENEVGSGLNQLL